MIETAATSSHRRGLALIAGCWLSYLGLLWLLGRLGLGTGLTVWPMGEDRNWIELLQRGSAGATARGFWAIDHRNPLSPWWYILFRPAILGWPNGLFLLRHGVGLALALSSYALVALWLGPRARAFGAALGCLIVVWTANAYFDQIYWNFLGALTCSILSVACYLLHLRRPGSGYWLALSLVLWLVAIATYTIQAGAILAIALATWRFAQVESLAARLLRVAGAALPFAAILLLFLLIWQTTSVPADGLLVAPDLGRTLASLRQGLWHDDIVLMGRVLARAPEAAYLTAAGSAAGLAVFAFLPKAVPGEVPKPGFAEVLLLAACFAAPTILVETVGLMWTPGSRWRMIYQFTTPAIWLSVLAMAASLVPARAASLLWRGGFAALFAGALTLSLGHNHRQVAVTASERALQRTILADAVSLGLPQPLQYLVMIEEGTLWQSGDGISPVYARTWFRAPWPSFRLVPGGNYHAAQSGPPVTFLPDAEGVANATLDGRTLPYSAIRIVRADRGRFTVLDRLERADLAGFRAEWKRDGPLSLAR